MSQKDIKRGDVLVLKSGEYRIYYLFPEGQEQGELFKSVCINEDNAARPAIFLHPDKDFPKKSCWVLFGTSRVEIPWTAIDCAQNTKIDTTHGFC